MELKCCILLNKNIKSASEHDEREEENCLGSVDQIRVNTTEHLQFGLG